MLLIDGGHVLNHLYFDFPQNYRSIVLKFLFSLLFLPVFLNASINSEYFKEFSSSLQSENYAECRKVLFEWDRENSEISSYIKGLEGAVYLAEGNIEKCIELIDESVIELTHQNVPEETIQCILDWKERAINFMDTEELKTVSYSNAKNPGDLIFLCKQQQPKGVKLKYWFGVAQIVAGCLAAPFSGGTSTALIMSGTAVVVSATADALNNMEDWERDLNHRQRMAPEQGSQRIRSKVDFTKQAIGA